MTENDAKMKAGLNCKAITHYNKHMQYFWHIVVLSNIGYGIQTSPLGVSGVMCVDTSIGIVRVRGSVAGGTDA